MNTAAMGRSRMMASLRALGIVAALAWLGGCANFDYYMQSVSGQVEVWSKQRDIDAVLKDPGVPEATRDRLEWVLQVREFAIRDLKLPDNDSYLSYADLGRPFVVWNVFAAEEFSVRPVNWCFVFTGCVGYRGYFSMEEAVRFAKDLKRQGYEVHVGGVPAYSTLGWFADPLLNTVMKWSNPRLARLIFHELSHQVAYADGDTVFNESFAVAVETEGVKRWLAKHGTQADKVAFQRSTTRRAGFFRLIESTRNRLKALYHSDLAPDEMRARKKAIFADMLREYERLKVVWGGFKGYDRWFGSGVNNAHMASVAAYSQLVPAFQALLAQEGGDLRRFYRAVKRLAQMPRRERAAAMRALAPRTTASAR